jgi:energy-coupling factor transporter ATP-binding protein EcfA2
VSLARTIVTNPGTLLLDEPFAALDPRTRADMQHWLRELQRRLGLTVVLVTHDVDEALALGDRVALFSARPGRILREWRIRSGGTDAPEMDPLAVRQQILSLYQTDVGVGARDDARKDSLGNTTTREDHQGATNGHDRNYTTALSTHVPQMAGAGRHR